MGFLTGRLALTITRSPAQRSACKDLSRNGQSPAITSEATYTPISNRAGSRSHFEKGLLWKKL
ncbi:alpha-galactosidase [Lacticaseibacillus rhamnosus]|nr:alpha-galactosidase [Lacticaseibacillus rhamnosus]RXS55440.1 alpha-galactosidase [Lacticaseibacillus rhamnosus]TLQ25454.1 alpha-galactosidase [Lacticaseibacillus rhamnosus]